MALLFATSIYFLLGFVRFRALAACVFPSGSALNARDVYLLQQPGVLHAAAAWIVPVFALQMLLMMLFEALVFLLPSIYRVLRSSGKQRLSQKQELSKQELSRESLK